MKATDTFRSLIYSHNCAQAVANKWHRLYPEGAAIVTKYAPYGSGHAPGGCCGALYAAMQAIPDRADEIAGRFASAVGETHCHEIKSNTGTSCHICVDTADRILEEIASERQENQPQ